MNSRARKKFWNTLCSLDGIDVKADERKLVEAMQYPRQLYRFRPVSFSSLDALQSNKLYFSSADPMMIHLIRFYISTFLGLKMK